MGKPKRMAEAKAEAEVDENWKEKGLSVNRNMRNMHSSFKSSKGKFYCNFSEKTESTCHEQLHFQKQRDYEQQHAVKISKIE